MQKPISILLIHYYFPPIKSTGTLRNHRFYTAFKEKNADIKVLTTSNRKRLLRDPLPVDEADIIPITTFDLRRWLSQRTGGNTHLSISSKQRPLWAFLTKLADSFPFNIFLADGGILYVILGFMKGKKLLKKTEKTIILSSFRPWADHWIAYLLKCFRPNLIWVADFRDPHVDMERKNVFWPRFQLWVNRFFVKRADFITTVSDGLAEHFRVMHPQVQVLRNGIQQFNDFSIPPYKQFTIAYTGSLYPGFQKIDPIFLGIKQLLEEGKLQQHHLKIIYAGKDGALWNKWIYKYDLQKLSENKGLLTYQEAWNIQRRSHINLLLSWSLPLSRGILTSKLYQYLGALKPIIVFINGHKETEWENLIEKTHAGKVFDANSSLESIQQNIVMHYQQWLQNGDTRLNITQETLDDLSWPTNFDRFLATLPL